MLLLCLQVTVGSLDLSANKDIRQYVEVLEDWNKYTKLQQYLREHNDGGRILVFVETKKGADQLVRSLKADGWPANSIHGDKTQEERDFALKEFREGRKNMLVATDVASRGIDVKDVRMVINFDFPNNMEDYIHRIGRTARAGAKGTSVAFFTTKNARNARELAKILQESGNPTPPELANMSGGSYGGGAGGRSRYSTR